MPASAARSTPDVVTTAPGTSLGAMMVRKIVSDTIVEFYPQDRRQDILLEKIAFAIASEPRLVIELTDPPKTKKPECQGGLAGWQVRRCRDYMTQRIEEDVSVDELARIARISKFHFSRAFKRATGVSPGRYFRELKGEHAKQLLSDPSVPICQIAFALGYESQQAFSRMFKRYAGTSPKAWRDMALSLEAA